MDSLTYARISSSNSLINYIINNGKKVDKRTYALKNTGKVELLKPFLTPIKASTILNDGEFAVILCKRRYLIKNGIKLSDNIRKKRISFAQKEEEKALKRHKIEEDVLIPANVVIKMFGQRTIEKHKINQVVKKDGCYYVSLVYLVQKMKSGARAFLAPGIPVNAERVLINEFPYLTEELV